VRSPVADLLSDLGAGLSEIDAPWYLFGARAAILYGVARLTADVDVTVRLRESTTGGMLADALERCGFRLRIADAEFVARTRVMPFVHEATGLPLDVVLAGPGLEDQFFAGAVVRDIDGVRVPVASAEDVVVMKLLADRPKDQEDIVAIAAAQGDALDEGGVRRTLIALEEALAQDDLQPAFDAALARARRIRQRRE
jgi:hypothetical protein